MKNDESLLAQYEKLDSVVPTWKLSGMYIIVENLDNGYQLKKHCVNCGQSYDSILYTGECIDCLSMFKLITEKDSRITEAIEDFFSNLSDSFDLQYGDISPMQNIQWCEIMENIAKEYIIQNTVQSVNKIPNDDKELFNGDSTRHRVKLSPMIAGCCTTVEKNAAFLITEYRQKQIDECRDNIGKSEQEVLNNVSDSLPEDELNVYYTIEYVKIDLKDLE